MERSETASSRWVAARWRPAFGVAVASEFAGLIHLAFAREHLHEWVPFGLFFLASGLFQVVWAVMVFSPQPRAFFVFGLAVNVATVVLWAVTRTTGLPIGPEHWTREAVGGPDLVASILELLLAGGCVWILEANRRSGRPATY
jgi:hypothetical protein